MAYRTFLGVCVSTVIVAACSGDEAAPAFVPPEGSAVVDDGRWVGRVTSSRRSAVTDAVIGLAWVPAHWAEEGWPFDIQHGGVTVNARVTLRPFYDPEGARLRS